MQGWKMLEAEIVRVSKQFTVLSRFTAFLAVDRSEVVNKDGKVVQIVPPVERPAGWEMEGGGGGRYQTLAGSLGGMMPPMAPQAVMSPARGRMMVAGPASSQPRGGSPPLPGGSLPGGSLPVDKVLRKEEAPDASSYLAKLEQLARDLETLARDGADVGALRLLRQRLTEWVEDLRSVGGHDALAAAVEHQVTRVSAALASGANVASEALAVATELARLAGGGAPPRKSGREGFWK